MPKLMIRNNDISSELEHLAIEAIYKRFYRNVYLYQLLSILSLVKNEAQMQKFLEKKMPTCHGLVVWQQILSHYMHRHQIHKCTHYLLLWKSFCQQLSEELILI